MVSIRAPEELSLKQKAAEESETLAAVSLMINAF